MKKEFGKWLMDIAKYMVTALLLSSSFGNMNNPLIVACVVVASASTLGAGLWLISNTEKKKVNYGSNRSFSFCYNCSNRRCNLLQPPRQEKGSKSQMRKELVVFPFLP